MPTPPPEEGSYQSAHVWPGLLNPDSLRLLVKDPRPEVVSGALADIAASFSESPLASRLVVDSPAGDLRLSAMELGAMREALYITLESLITVRAVGNVLEKRPKHFVENHVRLRTVDRATQVQARRLHLNLGAPWQRESDGTLIREDRRAWATSHPGDAQRLERITELQRTWVDGVLRTAVEPVFDQAVLDLLTGPHATHSELLKWLLAIETAERNETAVAGRLSVTANDVAARIYKGIAKDVSTFVQAQSLVLARFREAVGPATDNPLARYFRSIDERDLRSKPRRLLAENVPLAVPLLTTPLDRQLDNVELYNGNWRSSMEVGRDGLVPTIEWAFQDDQQGERLPIPPLFVPDEASLAILREYIDMMNGLVGEQLLYVIDGQSVDLKEVLWTLVADASGDIPYDLLTDAEFSPRNTNQLMNTTLLGLGAEDRVSVRSRPVKRTAQFELLTPTLQFLDEHMRSVVRELQAPGGVWAASVQGKHVLFGSGGFARLQRGTLDPLAMPPDAIMQIGSVTKDVFKLVAVSVVEDPHNSFTYDTTVGEVFPDIPLNDHVASRTFGQLLTNSADLRRMIPSPTPILHLETAKYFTEEQFFEELMRDSRASRSVLGYDLDDPIAIVNETQYGNAPITLAALMLQKVSGRRLRDMYVEMETRLGSGLAASLLNPYVDDRFAVPYSTDDLRDPLPRGFAQHDVNFASFQGAANMRTLVQLGNAYLGYSLADGKRLLSETARHNLLSMSAHSHENLGDGDIGYSYGPAVERTSEGRYLFSSDGTTLGFRTSMVADPESGVVFAFGVNNASKPLHEYAIGAAEVLSQGARFQRTMTPGEQRFMEKACGQHRQESIGVIIGGPIGDDLVATTPGVARPLKDAEHIVVNSDGNVGARFGAGTIDDPGPYYFGEDGEFYRGRDLRMMPAAGVRTFSDQVVEESELGDAAKMRACLGELFENDNPAPLRNMLRSLVGAPTGMPAMEVLIADIVDDVNGGNSRWLDRTMHRSSRPAPVEQLYAPVADFLGQRGGVLRLAASDSTKTVAKHLLFAVGVNLDRTPPQRKWRPRWAPSRVDVIDPADWVNVQPDVVAYNLNKALPLERFLPTNAERVLNLMRQGIEASGGDADVNDVIVASLRRSPGVAYAALWGDQSTTLLFQKALRSHLPNMAASSVPEVARLGRSIPTGQLQGSSDPADLVARPIRGIA